MRPFISSLIAIGGALTLSACASYGPGGYYGGGPLAYDAYYDDFYGPYYGGYWGPDNVFVFSRSRHGRWERDDGHHFRHDGATGFHGVRTAHAPGMGWHGMRHGMATAHAAPGRPGG